MSATEGPWIARQQFHAYHPERSLGWIIETENGSRIGWSSYADAVTNEEEKQPHEIGAANAYLIASAPALLSALKDYEAWEAALILDTAAWRGEFPVFTADLYAKWMEIQAKRNAAIALAEGGAS